MVQRIGEYDMQNMDDPADQHNIDDHQQERQGRMKK